MCSLSMILRWTDRLIVTCPIARNTQQPSIPQALCISFSVLHATFEHPKPAPSRRTSLSLQIAHATPATSPALLPASKELTQLNTTSD
jgi:hypothetical protein